MHDIRAQTCKDPGPLYMYGDKPESAAGSKLDTANSYIWDRITDGELPRNRAGSRPTPAEGGGAFNTYPSCGPDCEACLRSLSASAFPAKVIASMAYHNLHPDTLRWSLWHCKECRAQAHEDGEAIYRTLASTRDRDRGGAPPAIGAMNPCRRPLAESGPATLQPNGCSSVAVADLQDTPLPL